MTDPIPIYTIGYGARSVEALLAVLQTWQIAFVIDIRSAPYSRFKPEFSKESLAREIERRHIRYLYMGDLLGGRPADPACYRDGKVDYDLVKQTAAYQEGIGRLRRAFAQQRRVVLLCSEYLFVGDTVFQGSIGRTDLEGGSDRKLEASLRKFAGLPIPKETQLLPGHGDFSTYGEELETNYYIKAALRNA